jgi:toxin-antitoxin system PIN domain toxin
MILVDINLLVFAHNPIDPFHSRAKTWWETELRAKTPIALPWSTLIGFLRLTTVPAVMKNPISGKTGCDHVDAWLACDHIQIASPGPRHWQIFAELVRTLSLVQNSIPDAHLAAMAIEHGYELCSADRGFERFRNLNWRNPIAARST